MIFSDESGIKITPEIIVMLNRCIQIEAKASILARKIGTTKTNITTWLGKGKRKGEYIVWDQWEKVRAYLIKVDLIDADDPKWMLPSQMRERLDAIGGGRADDDARRLLYLFSLLSDAGRSALLKTAESMSTTPGLSIFRISLPKRSGG